MDKVEESLRALAGTEEEIGSAITAAMKVVRIHKLCSEALDPRCFHMVPVDKDGNCLIPRKDFERMFEAVCLISEMTKEG